MSCPRRSSRPLALLAASLIGPSSTLAQDPPQPPPKVEAPAKPLKPGVFPLDVRLPPPNQEEVDAIKPSPPTAIPDDPPPHEGAFFDIPLTIEPPDILVVEALEVLPGRPVTGERLVRPDGTISFGFYGDVHVRGLTISQAKAKIVLHLRKYVNDQHLGLEVFVPEDVPEGVDMRLPNDGRNPSEPNPSIMRSFKQELEPVPKEATPVEKKPEDEPKSPEKKDGRPSARLSRTSQSRAGLVRRIKQDLKPPVDRGIPPGENARPEQKPDPAREMEVEKPQEIRGGWMFIDPAETSRLFVDLASYNSKVYFVQGDVGTPGSLPFTGRETVLDALNYAGGLLATAEPTDIHLYRPARGGKPAKDYKIDLYAIRNGIATANLQVFPNDRIAVGRNPIVARTVEMDRAVALINSMNSAIMQYAYTARSMGLINTPTAGGSISIKPSGPEGAASPAELFVIPPAKRDAMVKEWAEFLWSISSKEGGAMLDEKAFKQALMKKLTPSPEPK